MDPLTIAIIATSVGTGVAAYSQYQQGQAEDEWKQYEAGMLQRQAKEEEAAAAYEAEKKAEESARFKARQRALYAKAGVVGEGTPWKVLGETAKTLKEEEMLILHGGQVRADQLRTKAALSKMEGKAAYRAGMFGAGTSLLSGISRAAWMKETA